MSLNNIELTTPDSFSYLNPGSILKEAFLEHTRRVDAVILNYLNEHDLTMEDFKKYGKIKQYPNHENVKLNADKKSVSISFGYEIFYKDERIM